MFQRTGHLCPWRTVPPSLPRLPHRTWWSVSRNSKADYSQEAPFWWWDGKSYKKTHPRHWTDSGTGRIHFRVFRTWYSKRWRQICVNNRHSQEIRRGDKSTHVIGRESTSDWQYSVYQKTWYSGVITGYTEVSFTKIRKDTARIKTYPCNESVIVL